MKVTMILEGVPVVVGNVQRLRTTLTRQANQSAWNQAQHLFARTRAVVPYLDGELYESAFINNIGSKDKPMWAVGYDTVAVDYAVTVHETPNRVHPTRGPSSEPKQDHFLSEPRDAMAKSFARDIGDDMRQAVASVQFRTTASRRRR